jgi:hypothetical protein
MSHSAVLTMKLLLALVSLLLPIALAAPEECPPLVVETQPLPRKAKAGRVTTLRVKLQAPSLPAPAEMVIQVTLPLGVVLRNAHQTGGRTEGGSWMQEGANVYFSDLFLPSKMRTDVLVEVEVDDCPPDPLTFNMATYVGNSSYCYTAYSSKSMAIIPGHKFCPSSSKERE